MDQDVAARRLLGAGVVGPPVFVPSSRWLVPPAPATIASGTRTILLSKSDQGWIQIRSGTTEVVFELLE